MNHIKKMLQWYPYRVQSMREMQLISKLTCLFLKELKVITKSEGLI
jgi:hypothetical protein